MVELSRVPMLHELKIHKDYFNAVKSGKKTAELRFDDRDFRTGDVLVLKEWGERKGYSGRELRRVITHMTQVAQWITGAEKWVILHMGKHETA